MKVHPAAEMFPMMDEDRIREIIREELAKAKIGDVPGIRDALDAAFESMEREMRSRAPIDRRRPNA